MAEFTRPELDALLRQADEVLRRASRAQLLIDAPRTPPTAPGAVDLGFIMLPPGAVAWPPGFYATEELDGLPNSWGRIRQYLSAAGMIGPLRHEARNAAPTILGRIFAGGQIARARVAARDLAARLSDPSFQALDAEITRYLELADLADLLQSRGVRLHPGGPADHLLGAARTAVEKAVDAPGSTFVHHDASVQARVLESARALQRDVNSEPALRREAERLLDSLTGERADILLRQLPVDALKTATNERLRFTGLDTIAVSTVADVLATPTGRLTQVPGIGATTARRLRAAAETLRQEAVGTHTTGIGDTPTASAMALVRLLAQFDQINTLDEIQRARRRRILTWAEQVPAAGGIWDVLVGEGPEWQAFLDDLAWADVHPEVLAPAGPVSVSGETWADYLTRPAHYQALLATLLELEVEGGEDLNADILERIRALRLDTTHLRDLHLRGYQSFGARFTLVQEKVILGDDMGLGKTVQALAAAAHLYAAGLRRTLVVCPASVLTNWERESRRFTDLPVYRAHGTERVEAVRAWESTGGICLLTYDGARTTELTAPDFVVVDEAHFIKNPSTGRTRAVRSLIDAASHALLLSGTPLENRVSEFATLVSFVAPELISTGMSEMAAVDFRKRIAPAYLRRNQVDVLDELPERLDQTDWIDLTPADEKHYASTVEEGNFMAMRRAAMTTPGAVPAKLERIQEIVEEAEEAGRRVLIFTYFLDVLDRLESALGGRVIGRLSGQVSAATRQTLIDDLASAPAGSVLLAQITAGGAGLNIQAASVVILVEPQVKPSIEAQAIARAHRMGQTSTVLVHRLIGDDTVDERMVEMLAGKTQLFDAYARPSESAQVDDAVDITEGQLAEAIIKAERERLGFDA
ncbi:MAG: DEAD/DEAH box helicase [Corynebacterium sp.]|uniref:DEAD/DEAH box helicase n=1 Tax=Corynebacterium sp. TaxID=1720 RepID=UPI0026DEC3B0|nr:DEAD/DEAH box helicase [Corynebacterium sp.]MDO5670317.1 DEAD/DEAH box helicase [Corynebacterium sp.]